MNPEPKRLGIRIGNQTAFSAATVAAPFLYAVENGFDAFEWFPDKKVSGEGWSIADIGLKTRGTIRKMALEHDMALSVHIPWRMNPMDPNAMKAMSGQVAFAKDLGARLMNLHLCAEQGIETYIQAIRPLMARLKAEGIRLSIENTPGTGPECFNALFEGLRKMPAKEISHVGMCLDPGHANLCPETLNNYLGYVDRLTPEIPIFHLHLHENYGDRDSHLPIFSGPSQKDDTGIKGLLAWLMKRNFEGAVILEQWPALPTLLNEARERLLKLMHHM